VFLVQPAQSLSASYLPIFFPATQRITQPICSGRHQTASKNDLALYNKGITESSIGAPLRLTMVQATHWMVERSRTQHHCQTPQAQKVLPLRKEKGTIATTMEQDTKAN
jgi:hypothetical protein